MRKTKIIWLVTATALILIGAMIFAGVMNMLNWDFRKLSTVKYETNSYEISDSFKDISINTDTTNVTVLPSDDTTVKVVCFEQVNIKHNVSVKDNTLCIESKDTRKWYQYIGINFYSSKITVYLPKGAYGELSVDIKTGDTEIKDGLSFESIDVTSSTGDVCISAPAENTISVQANTGDININNTSARSISIKTSTGDISLSSVSCQGEIKTSVTTGDITMSNVNCAIITSSGSTGDLKMTNVIANERFSITRSTGDVTFNKCDAYEIYVRVSTGDVKGSLLSDKIFIANASTGKVSVPHSASGGRCEITSTTGDIIITVQK